MAMELSDVAGGDEIAFFDVVTTVPVKPEERYSVLEFGAILVCPRTLEEKWKYSTLVRPADNNLISSVMLSPSGITGDAILSSPYFSDVADTVFTILHGRIWGGHNITKLDCKRIKEAFEEIDRAPPEPKGVFDSLVILTERFGRRAGDMEMATLASYFGLGRPTHRSLDDVRMNLQVVVYCATVLFLESSLPEALTDKNCVSLNVKHPILSLVTNNVKDDPFDMESLCSSIMHDATLKEEEIISSTMMPIIFDSGVICATLIEPDELRIASITFRVGERVELLHKNVSLQQIYSQNLKVRYEVKNWRNAGNPKFSFVVSISLSLDKVLDACDKAARRLYNESGGSLDWRNLIKTERSEKTIRLNLPTVMNKLTTEIYQKQPSGSLQKLSPSKLDEWELNSWIVQGHLLDIYISITSYDYCRAGLSLVANKIVIP